MRRCARWSGGVLRPVLLTLRHCLNSGLCKTSLSRQNAAACRATWACAARACRGQRGAELPAPPQSSRMPPSRMSQDLHQGWAVPDASSAAPLRQRPRSKAHFFKNLKLSTVLQGAGAEDAWTGEASGGAHRRGAASVAGGVRQRSTAQSRAPHRASQRGTHLSTPLVALSDPGHGAAWGRSGAVSGASHREIRRTKQRESGGSSTHGSCTSSCTNWSVSGSRRLLSALLNAHHGNACARILDSAQEARSWPPWGRPSTTWRRWCQCSRPAWRLGVSTSRGVSSIGRRLPETQQPGAHLDPGHADLLTVQCGDAVCPRAAQAPWTSTATRCSTWPRPCDARAASAPPSSTPWAASS